ncbi:MAG: YceI family protein [Acidimicrobiia bacterium]
MTKYSLIPEQSRVRIDGSSNVHGIRAESVGLNGEIEVQHTARGLKLRSPVTGWVEIEVAKLRASNPLVEAETKRRIDAKRFPTIRGDLNEASATGSETVSASGEITFRGVNTAVHGELRVERDGDHVHITGSQTFDIREWGLQPPKMLMLKVSPMITVTIDALGAPQ